MFLIVEQTANEVSLLPPIKQGGEGSIHPITGQPDMVAKVFTHPTTERAEKLRAMLDNQPVMAGTAVLLAWPVDRLFTPSGECVGYVMPYAKDKETFYKIAQPGTRPQWADHRFLLRTAKNIAIAVSAFHRHGYVLGDINEFNILVGPDASVAVVDTDSVQVRAGRQVFRCHVGKDGFTPPELIRPGMSYGDIDRYPHHDSFGLAVLIFQLLMDGNHPHGAQYLGTGTRPTLTDRIAQGYWPHSKNRNALYRPRRDAPPLESLSTEIQRLMRDCFEAGHKNPTCRPTADDWCKALTEAEAEWEGYPARVRYFYYRKLNGRECLRTFLEAFEWLRPAVTRVPRNVSAAACGVTAIIILVLLCLSWSGGSEAGPVGPDGRPIQGEKIPRLWRDVQSHTQK